MHKRCPNDNHGRMVVTVRCCPNCGDVVNGNIAPRNCPNESHAKMRRSRSTYCMDCGAGLAQAAGARY
jgi:rRNA maturation protein Nop10